MTPTRDPREALRAWRQSTGYTQRDVGALFGVVHQTVQWWESGRCRVPERVQCRLVAEGWLTRPRGHRRVPLNHTPLCPVAARCQSCQGRRAYTTRPPARPRPNAWLPEHDAWLRAHAGTGTVAELATAIEAAFTIPRTPKTLRWRLRTLGLSSQSPHLTVQQIAYFCGVSDHCAGKWAQRWLSAYQPTAHRGAWSIPAAAFEAFLREHAPMFQLPKMPASRYRAIVAQCWQRDRWLDMHTAARFAGLHHTTIRWHVYRGTLPATRANRLGARYWWMIRARDLAAFLKDRRVAG